MSTDEYVPSDEDMAHWFEGEENPEHGRALWSRWLAAHDARVRRDAAREAIDGLIADKAHMTVLLHAENGGSVEDVLTHYRDTHYPAQEAQP